MDVVHNNTDKKVLSVLKDVGCWMSVNEVRDKLFQRGEERSYDAVHRALKKYFDRQIVEKDKRPHNLFKKGISEVTVYKVKEVEER